MRFTYLAVTANNTRTEGEIEAESVKAAASVLRNQGVWPISITVSTAKARRGIVLPDLFGQVSNLEKAVFVKNLAIMLKSGFPISRAIALLAEQTPNRTWQDILRNVGRNVEAGKGLSASLAVYPKVFSPLFVGLINVGEVSGNMEASLQALAEQLRQDRDLVKKAKGALIYPSIVLGAMIIVAVLLFTFVLPKLTELFADFEVELPLLTQFIIGLVDFMKAYGLVVLAAMGLVVLAILVLNRTPGFQAVEDRLVLRLPKIGTIAQQTNLARFCRTLSALLRSGMPILEAVRTTGNTLANSRYRTALVRAESVLRSGGTLSEVLRAEPALFPAILTNMVQVGEESGQLDAVLGEVTVFYEDEVRQAVSNLSAIIEPVLMLLVGAGVAILAIGLVMPIYSLTQSAI